MFTTRQMLGIVFILMLLGLPMISFGAGGVLGWLGLLLILGGAALPPVARLAGLIEDPKKQED